ncbi:NADPH:quinone oxidoreductase family protein [Rhodococcus olei]|uniref:NADPH:quinone oxidoreductase family protein n=1 Tax=Rhodococcus olei TaxID=2161675 RepID=A0ABP8NVC2_9NOCA
MRAVTVTRLDGPSALEVTDTVPRPTINADDEVLVRVHAAGVTFPEVLISRGEYQSRPELPFTLGAEFAGEVVEVGRASRLAVGDRVAGIGPTGAFAEYVVGVDERTLPMPNSVDFVHAAAMPMNLLTADFALHERGRLQSGETVLVHGAAGGLGYASMQIALAMGARVIAVVSSAAKAETVRAAGAHEVLFASDFLEGVIELTGGRGVDVVVDPVGGDRFTDSLRALAKYGRVLVLGFAGRSIPTVKVNRLLLNNISVVGVGWGAATRGDKRMVINQWNRLFPSIEAGLLTPRIDRTLALDRVQEALELIDSRAVQGKVVLTVDPQLVASPA